MQILLIYTAGHLSCLILLRLVRAMQSEVLGQKNCQHSLETKSKSYMNCRNNSGKDAFKILQQTECSQAEDVHKSSYNLANRNDTNSQVILNHHLLKRCGTKQVASALSRTLSYSCWHWGKSRSGWSLQAWEHHRRVSWKAASAAWGPGGWTAWFASMSTAFPVACRRHQQYSWKSAEDINNIHERQITEIWECSVSSMTMLMTEQSIHPPSQCTQYKSMTAES